MKELKYLALDDCTNVSGDGLRFLAGLTKLEELNLENTGVQEAKLLHLLKLPNLRIVRLLDAPVTREEVVRFREKMPSLEAMNSGVSNRMAFNDYKSQGVWETRSEFSVWSWRKGSGFDLEKALISLKNPTAPTQ
jgi:hypothetical protein